MKLLDLFCGAGGAAMGYYRAGFTDITGIDNRPMKRYPFKFIQADALEYLADHGKEYDVIHASPPCQRFSYASARWPERKKLHRDLLRPTLALLRSHAAIWACENVHGAPLSPLSVMLCGLSFGLKVFRHRLFETPMLLLAPPHRSHNGYRIGKNGMVCLAGHGDAGHGRTPASHRTLASWKAGSGIDWMTREELAQAIPPAYTEWIGHQLMKALNK